MHFTREGRTVQSAHAKNLDSKEKKFRKNTESSQQIRCHGSWALALRPCPWLMALAWGVTGTHASSVLMHGNILTPPWRHRPRFSQINVSSQDYSVRWDYLRFFSLSIREQIRNKIHWFFCSHRLALAQSKLSYKSSGTFMFIFSLPVDIFNRVNFF